MRQRILIILSSIQEVLPEQPLRVRIPGLEVRRSLQAPSVPPILQRVCTPNAVHRINVESKSKSRKNGDSDSHWPGGEKAIHAGALAGPMAGSREPGGKGRIAPFRLR